jgi:multidrug efflux pump subunit AcrA (membrane-fusion protein)
MSDYEQDLARARKDLERSIERAQSAIESLDKAAVKTAQVLEIAKNVGVKALSIGMKSARVRNEAWPFGYKGSIFTVPGARDPYGYPLAWTIAEQAGISGGCGNTGQHSVDDSLLIDGVYELRAGKWHKIKKPSHD